jgi:membrane dipeptidase
MGNQLRRRMTDPAPALGAKAPFPVVDLHAHPALKSCLFKAQFWKAHNPPAGYFPPAMCVDVDALLHGGVKTLVCATYVPERELFKDVWPLGVLAVVHPRAKHIATAPMDQLTREHLDAAEDMITKTRRLRGDVIELARTRADLERITHQGKICMLHAVEGAHHLSGNLDEVDYLYGRGVCMMVVPHLYPNQAGGCVDLLTGYKAARWFGCFSPKHQNASGLSPWGHELVDKLLDVGIIVDPTHGPRELRKQVIALARKHPKRRPVVMSHVYLSASVQSPKAPDPEEIRALADTGGVIGIMMAQYPGPDSRRLTGIELVMRSIDHLVRHGGEDVVAIGSDFDGFTAVPRDLRSPRDYGSLRQVMLRRYPEPQVAKFLSGNAERVLKTGWGR